MRFVALVQSCGESMYLATKCEDARLHLVGSSLEVTNLSRVARFTWTISVATIVVVLASRSVIVVVLASRAIVVAVLAASRAIVSIASRAIVPTVPSVVVIMVVVIIVAVPTISIVGVMVVVSAISIVSSIVVMVPAVPPAVPIVVVVVVVDVVIVLAIAVMISSSSGVVICIVICIVVVTSFTAATTFASFGCSTDQLWIGREMVQGAMIFDKALWNTNVDLAVVHPVAMEDIDIDVSHFGVFRVGSFCGGRRSHQQGCDAASEDGDLHGP